LTGRLTSLVRADLFRQETDPRSPERGQYAFVQAVIREVAYSTLALRDRRSRHLAAARFFESLGDEELAGALASHYLAAYRSASEGPEAEALASQARISLRAAADRAIALGAPGQAVEYLEQAVEVTDDETDKAAMLEQAGDAAVMAARTDAALDLLQRAQDIRERLGDPRAIAHVIGRRAFALTERRQLEESSALVEAALDRFADLAEDPVGVALGAILARNLVRLGRYEQGLQLADRVLAAAERLQQPSIAAATMVMKGQAYGFQGRMWEARALYEGARILAEENGLTELALRATQSLSFEVALDDARKAVDLQREALGMVRRLGRRAMEITILGNLTEDARRTGDWDWILGEVDTVLSLIPETTDSVPLLLARQILLTHRGQVDQREIARIEQMLLEIEDPDIGIGLIDVRASADHGEGRWSAAGEGWLEASRRSNLNEPYILPRAGHAFVLAGDATAARSALDRLAEIGTRGRAVDADRAAIQAGIDALEGNAGAALAGYRTAIAAWRSLRLPWDEALTTLDAVTVLGLPEPDVAEWADAARATLRELRAAPLLARLEEAIEAARDGAPARPASATPRMTAEADPISR
jgi:tetratricopeptide (TPR) repeat protein